MASKALHKSFEKYTKGVLFKPTKTPRILRRFDFDKRVRKEILFIISGPAGSGKDTFVQELMSQTDIYGRPKTVTTRAQRPHEVDNDPYIRMSIKEFEEANANGFFIETNKHFDNWYGSPKSEVQRIKELGKIPILRIDPNGARNILTNSKKGEVIYAYIIPPQLEEIRERLKDREIHDGKTMDEAIKIAEERVLHSVLSDLNFMSEAHYLLLNHNGKIDSLAKLFNKEIKRLLVSSQF